MYTTNQKYIKYAHFYAVIQIYATCMHFHVIFKNMKKIYHLNQYALFLLTISIGSIQIFYE